MSFGRLENTCRNLYHSQSDESKNAVVYRTLLPYRECLEKKIQDDGIYRALINACF